MKYYETFKRIVEWMLSKDGIDTNTIVAMAGITMVDYQVLIEADKEELSKLKNSVIGKIQDFNKKHMDDFLGSGTVDKLPEGIEKRMEQATSGVDPVNSAEERINMRARQREKQKYEEEQFYEVIKQLHNVVPDHMTFDIFVKLK